MKRISAVLSSHKKGAILHQNLHITPWPVTEPEIMDTDRYLSSANAPDIEEDIRLCIDSGARNMILNCAPLKYMTAAGLRAFFNIARHMYNVEGTLFIKGLKGQPRELFFANGMDSIVPLVKEETRFPAYRD